MIKMKGWYQYHINDLAQVKGGKRLPKGKQLQSLPNTHPYIRVRDLNSRYIDRSELEYVPDSTYQSIKRYIVNIDDIIISIVGTIGLVAIIDEKLNNANLTENCVRLTNINTRIIEPKYLYYYLISPGGQNEISKGIVGSTQPKFPLYNVKDRIIICPKMSVQRKICDILSALDDKIELNLEMNKTLEEMAMAIFKEWFVDSPTNEYVEINNYIIANPKLYIPKGVEVPFVGMQAVSTNQLSVSDVVSRKYSSGSKFINGDTLLARITPCLENGKTAFVDFLNDEEIGNGSTEFIVLRSQPGISNQYVYCLCRDNNFINYAISCMTGTSGRQRVQVEPLMKYRVKEINDVLMKKFDDHTKSYFKQIRANTIENITLRETRDYLLPKLISGEIRVKEAASEVEKMI